MTGPEAIMTATKPVEMPSPSGPWTALRADHITTGSTTTLFNEGESLTT